jgi:AraC-like DNA-binding protein
MDKKEMPEFEAIFQSSIYSKREEQWAHVSYDQELLLLKELQNGNLDTVLHIKAELFRNNIHNGHLSADPLRQRKYELVAVAAVVSRFAIEAGLDVETSLSLSDAYIRTADTARNQEEVISLYETLLRDYASRLRDIKKKQILSKTIMRCIEYIDSNLHYPITLDALAAHTGKNGSYLSFRFKQEMEIPIGEYIIRKRLEEAKEMLARSESPISDIAATLTFNTQSYFSQLFRRHFGETPRQYRNKHYRVHRETAGNGAEIPR